MLDWRVMLLLEHLKDGLWHINLPMQVGEKTARKALDLKYIGARMRKGRVVGLYITRLGKKALQDDKEAARAIF